MNIIVGSDGLPRCCGAVLTPGGFCAYCRGRYDLAELHRFVQYSLRFFEEVSGAPSVTGYLKAT